MCALAGAGCSVVLERILVDGDLQNPINMADVMLFSAAGTQIIISMLQLNMSSVHDSNVGCLDGDLATICHTGATDADPWLRVTYPCAEGLSKVVIINRQDSAQERLQRYRMRAVSAGIDLAPAYTFKTVAANYTWLIGGLPGGFLALSNSLHQATGSFELRAPDKMTRQ